MSSEDERLVTALRSAMKENSRLRAELDRRSEPEPIAIVATGCRLPGGVDTPEQLWDLVSEGHETRGAFPEDRGWDLSGLFDGPDDERRVAMDRGSFLRDAFDFDPAFFGISPREAEAMEPQQRLLLELAWETLERAGIPPTSLAGSDTGVYVGLAHQEYGPPVHAVNPDGVTLTGISASVASGRISYCLGLVGPALTVDTACSSSLVALHLAVRALRDGDCSLALAGGATVMSGPGTLTEFTRLRGVSPDGRCKAFARDADGAAFSEGAGMVVLERLSDARRHGHDVLAVVRGGAVNQDGASNGLTAPNGPSQVRVIGRALADAGLNAADVDMVEAHGTGTPLGDPIEAQALIDAYGRGRVEDRPLWLGSLKSNIGHPQAAAGVAGVVKTVEALRRGVMPPTLHAKDPSTHVEWDGGVRLLHDSRPWSDADRPRRAAVSSFGMSGTNAHLILEQAPEPESGTPAQDVPEETRPATSSVTGAAAWTLSARSPEALAAQAQRLREHVEHRPGLTPADVGLSLVATRSGLEHRAVAVGRDREALLAALSSLETGTPGATTATGRARPDRRPVLVFPGQGGQWEGMAVELLDSSDVFAAHIAACERALEPHVGWKLTDVLRGRTGAPSLERVDVVQPALWAVMVSLARLWMAHGLTPAAVVGHSQGEVAAAHIAGALTLDDAAKVVALRSAAVLDLAGSGAMASIASSEQDVRERLAPFSGRVTVAAVNGPSNTVVAGEPDAVARVVEECEAADLRARMIAVDYASHSSAVDALADRITTELVGVTPERPMIPFYSTLTGGVLDGRPLDAAYWFQGLRQPVRFAEATRALAAAGHDVFVEVGPHPVLTPAIQDTLEEAQARDAVALGTLRRDEGGPVRFLTSLGQAHVHGLDLDWTPLFDRNTTRVALPTYAFQRQRYWRPGPESVPSRTTAAPGRSDGWTYREEWMTVPAKAATSTVTPGAGERGTWLLIGSRLGSALQECVGALEARGHGHRVLGLPRDADREAVAALVGAARDGAGPIAGVLLTTSLDTDPDEVLPPSTAPAHRDAVLVLQALLDTGVDAPLWCLTSGAVNSGSDVSDPAAALVWGFGRVAAQEHTDRWGGLVDLTDREDPRSGAALAAVLTGETAHGEDQLAIHGTKVLARRLARVAVEGEGTRDWRPSGTVLVTGGTGGLGAHTARWLAARGAEHLLLLSRRGPDAPGAGELAAELRAAGARVTLTACDVSDRSQLADVLGGVPAHLPLTAVFHTAADLDDAPVADLSPQGIARVLGAKADGAVHLHELSKGLDLSAFVLFSSVGAVFGVTGQGNYAPGNVFCESLAHHRRSLGLPATSIAWGAWEGAGMAGREAVAGLLRRHGLPTMKPELALESLGGVLDHDLTALTVADIDWPRFRVALTANRPSPLITDLDPGPEPSAATATGATPGTRDGAVREANGADLRGRLVGLGRTDRVRALMEHVSDHVAAVLGYESGDAVPADRGLKDLGMDSVTAVELRNRLTASTGARLPSAVAFDHPTCAALASHVEERMFGSAEQVVLERLDGLTAALDEYETTGSDRVADRLRELLERLAPGASGRPGGDTGGADLESASREELFALIDRTLTD
ncbi:type I polyketide synthase [Nocardiopsis sp. B62]|uniref:type I polyketide synthase n=1 Tax=Nocardiopsis sp. B62 TaxID=2824874 RepID=UPI001FFDA894|nr:type I polyketide synthase [Nocardiopsis sp. B62]